VEAAATALGIAIRAATAAPVRGEPDLRVRDFSGLRMRVSFRWGELSQALAGEPGQGVVGDFAPAVVEDEGVPRSECVIAGDGA